MYSIRIVQEKNEFYDLKAAWNALFEDSVHKEISLTWEWLYTWWEIFCEGCNLFIIVVMFDECVVGIAPLLFRERKKIGITTKCIELLGSGEDLEDEICSDYLGFILKKGQEEVSSQKIFEYILSSPSQWDEINLKDIFEDSSEFKVFKKCINDDYKYSVEYRTKCPFVELPKQWDEFLAGSKKRKKHIKVRINTLNRVGNVSYECVKDKNKVLELFPEIIRLHQLRWESAGHPGCFSSYKFTSFHKELILRFFGDRFAQVEFLKIDNEYVACWYYFKCKDRLYAYLSGCITDKYESIGLGSALTIFSIRQAISDGIKYYDYYKGKKGSYKYQWASGDRILVGINVFNSKKWKSRFIGCACQIRRKLTKIKNRLIK